MTTKVQAAPAGFTRWGRRYVVTAPMVLESPLSIGASDGSGTIDMPVLLDGMNRPVIPGTSIAGVLRALLEDTLFENSNGGEPSYFSARELDFWFGGNDKEDHASRVFIEDAPLGNATLEMRDGVGIDRVTGATAPEVLYNRQVVAAGARFELEISVEVGSVGADEGRASQGQCLAGAIRAVIEHGFQLGSSTSRGNGFVGLAQPEGADTAADTKSSQVRIVDRGLNGFDRTLEVLAASGETRNDRVEQAPGIPHLEMVEQTWNISINWKPITSVLVRSGADGNAVDDLPLVTQVGDDRVALVIPGSSLKGAFRSRAEWIVRTVLGDDSTQPVDPGSGDQFNKQLDIPLVNELFGTPAVADPHTENQGRGALTVKDVRPLCPEPSENDSTRPLTFDTKAWAKVVASQRQSDQGTNPLGPLMKAIRALSDKKCCGQEMDRYLVPRYHVAIDRWTGAPSSGALFSSLEVHWPHWEPITLELDMAVLARRLPNELDRLAAQALLLFVIRDFADGFVPIGFGVNRGHGSVEADWNSVAEGPPPPRIANADLGGSAESIDFGKLEKAWSNWIDNRNQAGTEGADHDNG